MSGGLLLPFNSKPERTMVDRHGGRGRPYQLAAADNTQTIRYIFTMRWLSLCITPLTLVRHCRPAHRARIRRVLFAIAIRRSFWHHVYYTCSLR